MFFSIQSLELLMHFLLKAIEEDRKAWSWNRTLLHLEPTILAIKNTYLVENTEKIAAIAQIKEKIQSLRSVAICGFQSSESKDTATLLAEFNNNLLEIEEKQPDYIYKQNHTISLYQDASMSPVEGLFKTKVDDLMNRVASLLEKHYPSKAVAQLIDRLAKSALF